MQQSGLPHPGEYLMLHPLQCNRCMETKKKMAQMKQQKKSPENIQGTNSDGKETETQVNDLEKEETFNQKRMKKQEFKKMKKGLGTSRTSLNIPTSEL